MIRKLLRPIFKNTLIPNIEKLNKLFERVCVFDSNIGINNNKFLRYSKIIAIGVVDEFIFNNPGGNLNSFQRFISKKNSWFFGYLTYDLKNQIEDLSSTKTDELKFPLLHFFIPKIVFLIADDNLVISYEDKTVSEYEVNEIYKLCFNFHFQETNKIIPEFKVQAKISKYDYIASVNKLKRHIQKGDIYEINFCQEFFSENCSIYPPSVYERLARISKAPFAAFCKFGKHYLLSSSPERFLLKSGNQLISQPIKGTINRSNNSKVDKQLIKDLLNDEKERAENVMIVDIVRNDLSAISKRGTVNVDELFGIYSFKQVHQMISTISCELKENLSFIDIIKSTFPMGSMTGAPKISAMKLIEEFESTKRGLYSGAIGYISPDGDFDFSVVIRSILYNEENRYLSFMVGSAITANSDAEKEYEECLLKAKALFQATNSILVNY